MLNSEIVESLKHRGASELTLARSRFNDHASLRRLGRYVDCGELLQQCRTVFEAEGDIPWLGKVYCALAILLFEVGHAHTAVDFAKLALRLSYQANEPTDCAIAHNNLGLALLALESDTDNAVAHLLAAQVLRVQTGAGCSAAGIAHLAALPAPEEAPRFEALLARVENIEGVHFRDMFTTLPGGFADGEAILAAIWGQVMPQRKRRSQEAAKRQASLDALPDTLVEAIESGGEEAFERAFAELPADEQEAAVAALGEAGLLPDERDDSRDPETLRAALADLPPALAAAIETGDQAAFDSAYDALSPKEQEAALATLHEAGLLSDDEAEPPADVKSRP